MKSYSYDELQVCLSDLGLAMGDCVLVQASLIDLGIMRGHSIAGITEAMFTAILSQIGATGTLVMTTFSLEMAQGGVFELGKTKSSNGVLSEFVRRSALALRSPHPLLSVAAIGPRAAQICGADPDSFYGPTGPIAELLAANAKVLLIGRRNVETASLAHYAEEKMQVPYRYWKEFQVPYQSADKLSLRTCKMYVRDLDLNPQLDLSGLARQFEDADLLRSKPIGGSDIRLGNSRKIVEAACDALAKNPWAFVAQ